MSLNSKKRNPKVVLSGYYGFDNCGDEAVLYAIVHCLRELRPDIRIVVLSGNPLKTRELYAVEAVNRWNPIMVAFEILTSRLVLSGGGSLLQDVTSSKSLRYYIAIIRLATILKKKVMIYSQGIGPLNVEKNRVKVTKALNRCCEITVRDESSARLLMELGVHHDTKVACDPVMALRPDDVNASGLKDVPLLARLLGTLSERRKPLLMAAVRQWDDNRHIAPIAEFLDTQAKVGWDVLLVPAHYPNDMEAINKITSLMTEPSNQLDRCLTAREFLAISAHTDRVFSMRLHGLICAMAAGTPMLGLSYDPKIDAFMEQAGLGRFCLPFDSFTSNAAELLLAEFDDLPPQAHQELEARRHEMREMAWEPARKAIELLSQ